MPSPTIGRDRVEPKRSASDNHHDRFRVSTVGYDNSCFLSPDCPDTKTQPHRLSVPDLFSGMVPGKNRTSSLHMLDEGITRKTSRACSIFNEIFKDPDHHLVDYNLEAAPRLENYRNSLTVHNYLMRPSLDELHEAVKQDGQRDLFSSSENLCEGKDDHPNAVKFGWIKGVYIRCLLNIWGVMLFLRMGWMTGQCGIILAVVIILLSTVVTVITTLSMSAICTNGDVRGGGVYYLISRSLGPEFGGVVGILLFIANAVSGALYILGAGEAIRDILNEFKTGLTQIPSSTNDIRVTSIICLFLLMSVTGIGMAFENKTQILLLCILLIAMADYFVGTFIPPTEAQKGEGFLGWNMAVGLANMGPDFRGESFFSVFAVFFPSVTGILAGANISGDLKDPCMAIPRGTFLSILTTSFSYIVIVVFLGFTAVRDATGDARDLANATFANCTVEKCNFGLMNDYQVMKLSSAYAPIIYAGIFAACLSSALVSIVSAPRILQPFPLRQTYGFVIYNHFSTFYQQFRVMFDEVRNLQSPLGFTQALCVDGIIPWLNWFGKGYGADNDPRRGLALTFVIAILFTAIGDLNAVAPIISNFFMAANGLINFSCFHASYVKSPGFRPGFQYYNLWLSLVGALLCVVIMFVMNWITALVTDVVVIALYIYISKTCPDINWGSSFQGYVYRNALYYLSKLTRVEEHVKNYRPAILVLTGNVSSRPQLVDIAGHLTKDHGLLMCANITKMPIDWKSRRVLNNLNTRWLQERKVKAFYSLLEAESLERGAHSLVQASGIGKMKPNILLMGFKENWRTCDVKETLDYFHVIHDTLDAHLSLCILRVQGGTNYSDLFETENGLPMLLKQDSKLQRTHTNKSQEVKISLETVLEEPSSPSCNGTPPPYRDYSSYLEADFQTHNGKVKPEKVSLENMANMFHVKQKEGTIDVWWLYDDGGLTMLLPYILTTRERFKDCKLRVFSVAQDDSVISDEQLNLAALLLKFRIPFTDLSIVSSVGESLNAESKKRFEEIISKFLTKDETQKDPTTVTRASLNTFKSKTNQFLRLRELLMKHSKDSNLIVMTLPVPRKEGSTAPLYMAWLDILTKDLPPFLLVRGNQTSVLTFYS